MIIDKNFKCFNNIPTNAVGVCKEMSINELAQFLDEYNNKENWGLYGYYNKFECAINRQLIEDKKIYRDICNILDRERAIMLDREYYKNN